MGGSSSQTIGYWYHLATHHGLCKGPIDAFIEYRGGTKVAWKGALTESGVIQIDKPELWGGEKDQGGIVGPLRLMFGEAGQMPNSYLVSVFGDQTAAWRGMTTVAFEGGKYGAMNPYPQKPSYRVRAITKMWEGGVCWYEATAPIGVDGVSRSPVAGIWPWKVRDIDYFVVGAAQEISGSYTVNQGWWHGHIDSIRVTADVARYAKEAYPIPTTAFGNAASDPHYSNVVMLLRMLGADGSTAFSDDKGHAVTSFGGAHISTARSKFGGSSGYFDGLNDYLKVAMGADANLGSGPWTIDAWVWRESAASVPNQYNRAIFGYGKPSVFAEDTVLMCPGNTWVYTQYQAPNLSEPAVDQTIAPFAENGRWAFVSICWDGANYWLHQDGLLLTGSGLSTRFSMNPAHVLVFAHTQQETGREPIETVNSVSAMAAADWFYAEGFGLCTTRRPEAESPAEFRRRIEKVAACSFSRSLADGLWYVDIANGEYDLASLPTLTDDDVLDFKEVPTVLDDAINSVSVKYFDPERKESIITPPVRALGLVSEFGEIHQTYDYPEIPTGTIATRVAQRELMSSCTPTRAFDLATTRKPYGWRQNTYFRLQLPKRGIADMVCLVGDLQHGQLKSGAIKLQAVQDIYSLPSTVYTEVEHGVDTRPDQTPVPIIEQRAIEAPYVDVVAALTRADMEVLPAEVGFLVGIAADPSDSIGFTMQVAPSGGEYVDAAYGDFCPTALVPVTADKVTEDFTITAGVRLAEVLVGAPVLWDEELCVVKAIDGGAGTISLGRGCADTVAWEHAAGSRLLFYGDDAAADNTEYTDGETVNVKLLTKTGSERLDAALATPMAVTFDQRQFRPYPPAAMTINAAAWPAYAFGVLSIAAAHRDRLLQANMLVDQSMATIGPEAATTYTIRYYAGGVLEHTESGITALPSTYTALADCLLRVELEAMRDGLASWQAQVHEFAYYLADPNPITDETGSLLLDEAGDFIY